MPCSASKVKEQETALLAKKNACNMVRSQQHPLWLLPGYRQQNKQCEAANQDEASQALRLCFSSAVQGTTGCGLARGSWTSKGSSPGGLDDVAIPNLSLTRT